MYMKLKHNSQVEDTPANDDTSADNEDEAENSSSQPTNKYVTEAESEEEITTVEMNAEATETNSVAQTT